jgi:RecB family exonuclease
LQRLIGSADDVVLSWPQYDDDVELRPSALLNSLQFKVTTIDSNQLQRSKAVTLAQGLFHHKPVLESLPDATLPAYPDGVIKQGSRVFELQSRCAFRAQAELRLHATSPDSPTPGISPLDRGKLIHRVLQEVWSKLRDSDGLRSALQDERSLHHQLQQIAGRVAQSLFMATTAHQQRMVRIEAAVACRLILSLLQHEGRRGEFSVLRSEERESFEVNGLQLHIQPDRIDQLQDGSLLLIDYKSSDNYWAKDWLDLQAPGRPRNPQLPLYALAHAGKLCGIAYAILAPGTTELRGLADRDDIASNIKDYAKRKAVYKPDHADDWPQLLQHWGEVMNALATQFKQGSADVNPLSNECQYCTLTSLCRIKEQQVTDSLIDEENNDE